MAEGKIADGWYQFDNDLNSVIDGVAGNGIITGLTQAEDSPADMSVVVAAGTYVANGTVVTKAAETDVTIEAADASNPRKDIIIGDSSGNITVVKGTAAAAVPSGQTGPNTSAPIPGNITADKIIICEVWVGAGVTTILDANLTDRRITLRPAVVALKDFTELTINAGGAITVTQSLHTVDTAADGATDNLDTINGGVTGMWVVLRAANGARTVVVRHNQDNIWLRGEANVSLDDLEDGILLIYDGAKWFDITAGGAGGGTVGTSGTPEDNDYAKFTNADTIEGRSIAETLADISPLTTRGDVMFRNATVSTRLAKGDSGRVLTMGASDPAWATPQSKVGALAFPIDGGGSVITTGLKMGLVIPFACTITRATIIGVLPAATNGSIVLDIWKDSYANHPPLVGDTITASAKPTISGAQKAQDSTLTGWTTAISAGDILFVTVDSVATFTMVTLSLRITKT